MVLLFLRGRRAKVGLSETLTTAYNLGMSLPVLPVIAKFCL